MSKADRQRVAKARSIIEQRVVKTPLNSRTFGARTKRPRSLEAAEVLRDDLAGLMTYRRSTKFRGRRVKELAEKYNVDSSTIREWLRDFTVFGLHGLFAGGRVDRGEFRLSKSSIRLILSLIRRFPDKSAGKIAGMLNEHYPQIAARRSGKRLGKPISKATILRMRNSFLRQLKFEEEERNRSRRPLRSSSSSLNGL